jgi:hypothetical protein
MLALAPLDDAAASRAARRRLRKAMAIALPKRVAGTISLSG